jgi:antitoxin CptB
MAQTQETPNEDVRLKRLRMRSWRRGTKEMDLILGSFCDAQLPGMSDRDVAIYEDLLSENDQDLYQWVTGQAEPPLRLAGLLARIAAHARGSAA